MTGEQANWWDKENAPAERFGLEGLPRTNAEVVALSAARASMRAGNDSSALFVLWTLAIALGAIAAWGGSVVLGALDLPVLGLATWWSATRLRRVRDARRMRARVAAEEDRERSAD